MGEAAVGETPSVAWAVLPGCMVKAAPTEVEIDDVATVTGVDEMAIEPALAAEVVDDVCATAIWVLEGGNAATVSVPGT